MKGFYASPYVFAVVIAALRTGRPGGYLAAGLSALMFNLMFVHPAQTLTWPTNEEWLAYVSMFGAAHIAGRFRPASQPAQDMDQYTGRLPFVRSKTDDDRNVFWDVEPTFVWRADCDVGHQYGKIYLERRKRYGAPVLAWIARDMIKSGRYTGVEAGFWGAVSSELPHHQKSSVLVSQDHTA